jgi:hypothetical protein
MTRRLILAAVTLLLLFPVLLIAQNEFPTIEFTGTVQSSNATALVINGLVIDISSAQINAPVVAGSVVRVWAGFAPDGSLVARRIDPVAPGVLPGLAEINGVIDQIDGSILLVDGLRVSIAGAKVDVPLAVGSFVIVYAEQTAPSEWAAVLVTGIRFADPILIAETPQGRRVTDARYPRSGCDGRSEPGANARSRRTGCHTGSCRACIHAGS